MDCRKNGHRENVTTALAWDTVQLNIHYSLVDSNSFELDLLELVLQPLLAELVELDLVGEVGPDQLHHLVRDRDLEGVPVPEFLDLLGLRVHLRKDGGAF